MGYQNFFATRLGTDIGAADAIITLETVPTVTTGTLVLEARNATQREIIKYTGVAGNTITGVTRGQGGTTAKAHVKNSLVEMNVTAEDLAAALALAFAFPTGIVMPYAGSIVPSGWLLADGSAVSRATYAALYTALGNTFGAGDGSTTFNLPDMRGRIPLGVGTGTFTETIGFAAVTTATDQLTISAAAGKQLLHGTPVVLTTTGGLPAPLALATTYYVIAVDATHIKLATNLANVNSGSAIDLTTQGTGNHTITLTLSARALSDRGGEETHFLHVGEMPAHTHGYDMSSIDTSANGSSRPLAKDQTVDRTGVTQSAGGNSVHNIMQPYIALNYIVKT